MEITRAERADVDGILRLLSQVLEIHAEIRPDIFVSGTTKYTKSQLYEMFEDDSRPVFVAKQNGKICGYAFCVIKEADFATTMKPHKSVYIDDFCVDSSARGKGVGSVLFEFVKRWAKSLGCADITLAVWEGNVNARAFYDKMGMTPRETVMELSLV